jgi:hypothetical protein
MITKEKIAEAYQLIQDEICSGLELALMVQLNFRRSYGKGMEVEAVGHV